MVVITRCLSALTIILIIVIFFAITGIGWGAFVAGVFDGVEKIGDIPIIQNIITGLTDTINSITNATLGQ